ncbi:MAG: Asp-tRNA(Asn)/Glu-tRNA(Gln) amidotransferase subunit GatC [Vicinamibacterales bacterium]
MSAGFTRERVAAIAALAHLDLDSTELDLFARQLGDILAYADQLQRIDTTGVPPTTAVLTTHPSDRADELRPSLTRDEVLANAPDGADAGLFRVPRVIG